MLEFEDGYIDRIYTDGKAVNQAHGHKDWGKGTPRKQLPNADSLPAPRQISKLTD